MPSNARAADGRVPHDGTPLSRREEPASNTLMTGSHIPHAPPCDERLEKANPLTQKLNEWVPGGWCGMGWDMAAMLTGTGFLFGAMKMFWDSGNHCTTVNTVTNANLSILNGKLCITYFSIQILKKLAMHSHGCRLQCGLSKHSCGLARGLMCVFCATEMPVDAAGGEHGFCLFNIQYRTR